MEGLEPVGLGKRRLQIDRSSPFFTAFLPHSRAMGLQTRQKLSSLGPIFAIDAPSPTGSWVDHNAPMHQRPFSQRLAQRVNLSGSAQSMASASAGLRSGATWAAGLLWLAAGLSVGYWFLQVRGQGAWTPVQGLAPSAPQADLESVARALGAVSVAEQPAAGPASVARLQLVGVVAQGRGQGAALIAIDGQPPRPWRVGAEVTDGLVLQSLDGRSARLGETRLGPTTMALEVPPQPVNGATEP